jgi:membrane associated rhomboid family serine protease
VVVLPLHDDNPVRRPAILTWLIIGACLVAYFLWQPGPFSDTTDDSGIAGVPDDVEFNLEHAAIPCEIVQGQPLDEAELAATYSRVNDPESCGIDAEELDEVSPEVLASPLWRELEAPDKNVWLSMITSMFLHGSLWHIGGNLLFLWVFGNNIEDTFGKIGFALFYVVGGIVATLTHVVLNLDSTIPMIGASGAIAAVMGAYMVLFPNARVRTAVFMLFIFLVELRAIWVLGFWFVLQFFTDPNRGVAWAAHVGGFVFGMVVGLLVRVLRPPQVRPAGWPPSPGAGYPDYRWRD